MRAVILSVAAVLVAGLFLLGIVREQQINSDAARSYEYLDLVFSGQPIPEATQPWYLENAPLLLVGACIAAAVISLLAAILLRLERGGNESATG